MALAFCRRTDESIREILSFRRLPDKQIPGLGLGLSYVRQIAEAHHGQVSLRSEVGKGTEVLSWITDIKRYGDTFENTFC